MKLLGINEINDFNNMLESCKSLTFISNMPNLDSSNITSMSEMFSGCNSLITLNFIITLNSIERIKKIYYYESIGAPVHRDLKPEKNYDE